MDSDLDHILPVLDQLGVEYKLEVGRARMLCPWHQDSEPSFYIFDNNSCYCFGCQHRCWHDELVAKLADCTIIEAKKKLKIYDPNQEYTPSAPKSNANRYDFADEPRDFSESFEKLTEEIPTQMEEFLDKKGIKHTAINDGLWRWCPRGVFKCWQRKEGICIPYFGPEMQITTFRLREWDRMRQKFGHPIAPKGVGLQPSYYVPNKQKEVFFVEGETDAMSLISLGLNCICFPGVGAHKQINSAIMQCFEWGIPKIIFCGDNDEAGRGFNDYCKKATLDLSMGIYNKTVIGFLKLPDEYNALSDGTFKRKDINDFLVEGRLKKIMGLENPEEDILSGAVEIKLEEEVF